VARVSYGLEPGVDAARLVESIAPVVDAGVPDPDAPDEPLFDELDVVSEGIVSEMLTFDDPPVADDRPPLDVDDDSPPVAVDEPPLAVDMPIPPTDEELELVVAVELADVPMVLRLEPPPIPMPVEVDPDTEPEVEVAAVSAWTNGEAQNRTAQASCKVVFFMMVLRMERGTPRRMSNDMLIDT
jgi:hypothetical protein